MNRGPYDLEGRAYMNFRRHPSDFSNPVGLGVRTVKRIPKRVPIVRARGLEPRGLEPEFLKIKDPPNWPLSRPIQIHSPGPRGRTLKRVPKSCSILGKWTTPLVSINCSHDALGNYCFQACWDGRGRPPK